MQINFSKTETEYLGLRFGRCETEKIEDPRSLRTLIEEGHFDVIRLKVPASYETVNLDLSETGFPYYFSGGIRRYSVDCFEAPLPAFTHPDIHFELYTGQKHDLLLDMIADTWGEFPIGYYKTPGLANLITKKKEADCLFSFYATYNNHLQFPDAYLWFMYKGDTPLGFIALYVYRESSKVDSTIAGVYRKFQNQGYFPNILRHIRGFCRENDLKYFTCGARNENIYSQWAFENDFMKGTGVEYVYHILPLLHYGNKPTK